MSKVGRIDYSPDYRSDKERWNACCDKYGPAAYGRAVNIELAKGRRLSEALQSAEREIELAHLRDAVIEAAKGLRQATL